MGLKNKVILQSVKFRKKDHVAILCPSNAEIDEVIREIENAEWSTGYRFWHLPLKATTIKEITLALKGIAVVDSSAFKNFVFGNDNEEKLIRKRIKTEKPSKEQQKKLESFKLEFIEKGYSEGTVKVYICMLNVFFGWMKNKKDIEIIKSDIDLFLEEYIEGNNFTTNYKRLMTNSLRRYFDFIGKNELTKI